MSPDHKRPDLAIGGFNYSYLISEWKSMLQPQSWLSDISAGTTVALVALPLNLALAISAGVEPGIGITTGIIAAIIAALFGGMRLAVTGPAAAMAVVLVEIARTHGIEGIWMVGLIAGLLQVLAGFLKLGKLIAYIPMPVMVGFANGIGILVFFNAIDDFIGLTGKPIAHAHHLEHLQRVGVPEFFLDVGDVFIRGFIGHEFNFAAIGVGALALVIALASSKISKKIPGALLAIIAATAVTDAFNLKIPTIATISSIPNVLPFPSVPDLPWQEIEALFPQALTVFMLGSIESLLSASVADGMVMSTKKHNSNQELIGQGLANLIVPFFGGIPVTGVIARTAVNIRAGARTRLSPIIHSIVLTILIFFLARYAEQIPLSALAAILMITGFRLIEWDALREIWKGSRAEAWAVFATTMASVCIDLTAGVIVGLIVACALFIRQMSKVQLIDLHENDESQGRIPKVPRCQYVKTYAVEGPLFFGAAERFIENIVIVDTVKAIVLHMGAAKVMDLTGVETLLSIHRQLERHGGKLILSNVPLQPLELLERTGAAATIGKSNIYRDFTEAVLSVNIEFLETVCGNCKFAQGGTIGAKPAGALKKLIGKADHKPVQTTTTDQSDWSNDGNVSHQACSLRHALSNEANPITKRIREMQARSKSPSELDTERLDWLVYPDSIKVIPEIVKNTPIETLIRSQNFGHIPEGKSEHQELIVGTCIDFHKELSLPENTAITIIREGANMLGAEFTIALALSRGTKHMALIAHNHCAMANTMHQRDNFIAALEKEHGWSREKASKFFDDQGRSTDIGNEIDFVLDESKRLTQLFPGLMVVPLVFRQEDDRLYFVLDWLMERAPNEEITESFRTRLLGKASLATAAKEQVGE